MTYTSLSYYYKCRPIEGRRHYYYKCQSSHRGQVHRCKEPGPEAKAHYNWLIDSWHGARVVGPSPPRKLRERGGTLRGRRRIRREELLLEACDFSQQLRQRSELSDAHAPVPVRVQDIPKALEIMLLRNEGTWAARVWES